MADWNNPNPINTNPSGDTVYQGFVKTENNFNDVYDKLNTVKKLQTGTTAPSNPAVGELWFDENAKVIKRFDGTNWVSVDADTVDGKHFSEIYRGFKNVIINGDFQVNQRGFNGDWSALAIGDYGYDRWKKYSDTKIAQVVEDIMYKKNTVYTLSYYDSNNNRVVQQLTSPSSGHWTIVVPIGANYVQLEEGDTATDFEYVPFDVQLMRCMRYYETSYIYGTKPGSPTINACSKINNDSTWVAGAWKVFLHYTMFKVHKRTIPTVVLYSKNTGAKGKVYCNSDGNDYSATAADIHQIGFMAVYNASGSDIPAGTIFFNWTADAEL